MYNMRESNDSNSLIKTAIIGVGIIALATIPIWLPYLLGKTVKGYECGLRLNNNNSISLYCWVSLLNP